MTTEKILAVDDDPGLLTLMKARLESAQYEVTVASGGEEALVHASENVFSAAILDLKMEDMDGIALMEQLLKIQPYLPVIILTAYGTIERAVEATKKGAYDFLTKPFEAKDLLYRLEKALEVGRLKVEVDRLRHMVKQRYQFDNIIASSAKDAAHPEPGCPDRLNGFYRLPLWRERHRQGVDGKGHSPEQPPFKRPLHSHKLRSYP